MAGETRPWGHFEVLDEGAGFKVKRIVVQPGGRLSLQSHERRSEHWVVVNGRAQVTVGDRRLELGRYETVHIPLGARHRLENPFGETLEIIEVQCGEYLGEDDIRRYEDAYSRV